MLSELATPHIRCCLSAIPSDLMKSTVVDESLSSMNQQFCSRENQLLQLETLSFQKLRVSIDLHRNAWAYLLFICNLCTYFIYHLYFICHLSVAFCYESSLQQISVGQSFFAIQTTLNNIWGHITHCKSPKTWWLNYTLSTNIKAKVLILKTL